MLTKRIPVTILTGASGSGKTTLLANLLKPLANKRYAVLSQLDGQDAICQENSVYASLLGKGLYFEVTDEFCSVIEQLVWQTRERSDQKTPNKQKVDQIFIETNGLEPVNLFSQALEQQQIKEHIDLDWFFVLDAPSLLTLIDELSSDSFNLNLQAFSGSMVDARNVTYFMQPKITQRKKLYDEMIRHLRSADCLVLSKMDLLGDEEMIRLKKWIAHETPGELNILCADHKGVFSNGLSHSEMHTEMNNKAPEGVENEAQSFDVTNAQDELGHFDSLRVVLGEVNCGLIENQLQVVMQLYDICRIKGFLALPGKSMRQAVQVTDKGDMEMYFDRLWQLHEKRCTQLLFIGKNLNKSAIRHALKVAEVMTQQPALEELAREELAREELAREELASL